MSSSAKRAPRKALVIVGVILLLCAAAAAVMVFMNRMAAPKMVDGVLYSVQKDTGEVFVSGCDPEAAALTILPEYDGKPVTAISSQAFRGSKAETVVIPNSVKSISYSAFAGSGIRSVEIPASVKKIDGAFADCAALEQVTFLGPRPQWRDFPFSGCSSLKSIVFTKPEQNVRLDRFSDCEALEELHFARGSTLDFNSAPPDGVTLYLQDADRIYQAISRGLPYAVEEGAPVRICDLSDAMENGLVSSVVWDREIDFTNETREELFLTIDMDSFDTDDKHVLIDDRGFLILAPGERKHLWISYYTDYGPGETTFDLVTESMYARFQFLAREREVVETVELSPYERQTVVLPAGRYGLVIGTGDSAESAREDTSPDTVAYFEAADGKREELREAGGLLLRQTFGEYGPETSKLALHQKNDEKVCYRLMRVGDEQELEVKLFGYALSKTVTFPSGVYTLRIAEGDEWISDEEAFGPDGKYSAVYYFRFEPGETYGITTTTGLGNIRGSSAGAFAGG